MHQPLYSMSAGERGETAAEVEDYLELVLELTSKWNTILLLDECDIFLEACQGILLVDGPTNRGPSSPCT
jgi:hypothetical protein